MRGRILLAVLLIGSIAAAGRPLLAWDLLWTHQFTSSSPGFIGAYGGATDATGVYATGPVFGELGGTTGLGGTDGYVRKLDHSGNVMWTRRIGTARYDDSTGVAADADGVYVTGRTCGALPGFVQIGGCDAYVVKLDSNGSLQWATQFGTPALEAPYQYKAITAHPSGVYVAGSTFDTFPGGPTPVGGSNTFLARIDRTSGAVLWVRQFGVPDPSFFNGGGVGADDTGVAVAANTTFSPTGWPWRAEVRKYTHDGVLRWSRVYDDNTQPCGHAVFGLTSHRGNVYFIGQTYEWALTSCVEQPYGQSYVIGRLENLDESGHTVWQRRVKAGMPGRPGGAGIAPFTGAKSVHATDEGILIGANVRKLRFAADVRREPHRAQSECSDPGYIENAVFQG